MSSPKGFPTQEYDDRLKSQFATVEPVRELQHGLSVNAHMYVRSVGNDVVEANSTTILINATAHAAHRGDVIRFTSGALSGQEVKVWEVTANTITLAEELASAPALAVTFEILRHKYPVVAADGSLSVSAGAAGPIQYVLDGVDTDVNEDTVTPANNRPLPVKLTGFTGDITVTAQQLNVAISHVNDSVRLGDGTDLTNVTAAGELNVLATAQPGVDIGDVTINNAAGAAAVNIQDGGNSITIDATSLPLPTGAATEATLASIDAGIPAGLGAALIAASMPVNIASNQVVPVSATSLPLPTGAATSANQTNKAQYTHLTDGTDDVLVTAAGELNVLATAQPGVDIGDVTINNAAGAAAVNIQDGGNSITVDGTVAATQSGTWNINDISGTISLPTGASTSALQTTGNTSLASILANQTNSTQFTKLTDGSDTALITAAGEQNVLATAQPGVDIGDVTINNAAGAAAVNIQDGGNSITVDATSLPLPTGAATAANQATEIASLASIDAGIPAALGTALIAASMPVNIASDQVVPISATSLPLPTGAATSALQTTGNTSLASIDAGIPAALGQTTSAASMPVVIASDQSAVKVTQGLQQRTFIRNDYSSVNVTTAAYVQLIASTAAAYTEIEIFDSSGQTLKLAIGAAASEVDQVLVFPGGNGRIPFVIASGARLSIRAVSATASTGEISINFYS